MKYFLLSLFCAAPFSSAGITMDASSSHCACFDELGTVIYGGSTVTGQSKRNLFLTHIAYVKAKLYRDGIGVFGDIVKQEWKTNTSTPVFVSVQNSVKTSPNSYSVTVTHISSEEVDITGVPMYSPSPDIINTTTDSCELAMPEACSEIRKADESCSHSPLVIDLGQDGFQFGGSDNPVSFDLYGTGFPLSLQWVTPNGNDAFLVHDINGNGRVDDGKELFGNGTRMVHEGDRLAENGFIALSQHDDKPAGGNNDGLITSSDPVWQKLRLWIDLDTDGRSSSHEMFALDDFGLTHLETIPRESKRKDRHGNKLTFWSWTYNMNRAGNHKYKMVDVFFKEVALDN
ncbi:MAG: hypothetical protein QNK37_24110 [Acidobacteriota bacterium]|nr:hypothetical protein [Acidobacteriota bacterium]